MRSIGAYELKTHLSDILDAVVEGETVTITRRGEAVAYLTPAPKQRPIQELITEMRGLRARMPDLGPLDIKDLIEDGRKQ